MVSFTPENLDPTKMQRYDYQAFQRGWDYYRSGRVEISEITDSMAICDVTGQHDDYTVQMEAVSDQEVVYDCTCPQAERALYCKHMVAANYKVNEYLREISQRKWNNRLKMVLTKTASSKKKPTPIKNKNFVFLGLEHQKFHTGEINFRLVPLKSSLRDWGDQNNFIQLDSPELMTDYFITHRTWGDSIRQIDPGFNPDSVVNLSNDGKNLLRIILKNSLFYHYDGITNFYQFLPLIGSLGIPLFSVENHKIGNLLHVRDKPVTIEAALNSDGENYILEAGVDLDGEIHSTMKENLLVMQSRPPAWVLAGDSILPVANPDALDLFKIMPHIHGRQLKFSIEIATIKSDVMCSIKLLK